jgi:hypothetical protein
VCAFVLEVGFQCGHGDFLRGISAAARSRIRALPGA